jgi:hypothetical protein
MVALATFANSTESNIFSRTPNSTKSSILVHIPTIMYRTVVVLSIQFKPIRTFFAALV